MVRDVFLLYACTRKTKKKREKYEKKGRATISEDRVPPRTNGEGIAGDGKERRLDVPSQGTQDLCLSLDRSYTKRDKV